MLRRFFHESGFVAALVGLLVFAAFPFYWMVITAFKRDSDL
jgi:multiple sugar transport system permease protein